MKKKIYLVKKGKNPGIYDDWKKCENQIKGFSGALFHSFEYRTEFEDEDENKEGSLRHAFMLAEKFMSDYDIGELKLVYQGRKKDYVEEDSWKKEGFLPFREGNADDAGDLQVECEENFSSGDIEPESSGKQELTAKKTPMYNYDHTKEREVYSMLGRPEHPHQNEPWLEVILCVAGDWGGEWYADYYVGRYHVVTLYTALVGFVFAPRYILKHFISIYRERLSDGCLPKITPPEILPSEWINAACEVWEASKEYSALKNRFEKYDMEYIDFNELYERCKQYAKDCKERILNTNSTTYKLMKKYIKQGGHSLSDLYREMTENNVYRRELIKVSGPYTNPDLEMKLYANETKASFEQLVMRTESIGMKLKEKVIGQDDAIDKLEKSFFNTENSAFAETKRKGPRNAFLFAGPSGVGKTFMAQLFAEELGLPFRRFDMSGYPEHDSTSELTGISTFWKNSKPGVLTDYVNENPHSVLLFDEIEKAHGTVVRLFLQILDDGVCFDRYYDTNISFEDTIIIFTTNAGKQLYRDAQDENLTVLPDKVVRDALEKDINPSTNNPFFPPEILSRMSSHTVIMFNHLKADALRRVVEKDAENQLIKIGLCSGCNLETGKSKLAKTVLYSMGGSADARNASTLAGKLINQQLYEFMNLMMQKEQPGSIEKLEKIEWDCDFTGAKDEVKNIYFGEKNCLIPVLGAMQYTSSGVLKENDIKVKDTIDADSFMEILHDNNVLFAVIDYTLGLENAESSLNIIDAGTVGEHLLKKTEEEFSNIPIFILHGEKSGYKYSDREKNDLIKRGVRGFIDREFYKDELEAAYWDVCCQKVMDTLARRHQVLTYKTRKEFDSEHENAGKIEFYDLKLETAVEAEDMSSILSDVERPDTKFSDVIGAKNAKEELEIFVKYLTNPKAFLMSGFTPKGILLYGPPGTGKTMLARAMAGESDVSFFQTSGTNLKGIYKAQGEANIRRIFERARKYAPSIIFIDEIDAIGKKRIGSENTQDTEGMLNALLTEMDGFSGADCNKPVFVLAATNYMVRGEGKEGASLDEALLRRFDNKIYVDLPNEVEREQYIFKMLDDMKITTVSKEEIHNIAARTWGMSLADIKNIFGIAARNAFRIAANDTEKQLLTITGEALSTALEEYEHGEKKEHTLDYYKCVAIHETGHAYVSYISGDKPSYITIESRGSFGGYMRHANIENVTEYTRDELLALIRTSLAGRAAEQVFYGKAKSLNTGAASDLKHATNTAFQIVCTYGMEDDQLITLSKEEVLQSALAGEYTAKVNEILKAEMKNAIEIIERAKDKIQKIADILIKENRLTGKQFEELMSTID